MSLHQLSKIFIVNLLGWLAGLSVLKSYLLIFGVLLLSGLGVPLPEDVSLITSGILVSLGKMSFLGACVVGFVGVMAGDCILFFLGYYMGKRAFTLPFLKKIFTPKRIKMASEKVNNNSKLICFTARFLPGLRSPIFLTAGTLKVNPLVFLALDGGAALFSVPIWVFVGSLFGNNVDAILKFTAKANSYFLAALFLSITIYFLIKKKVGRKPRTSV
ncbi:MAG: DedA family protein [Bdellovibrionaceae bacterium]|nr:DedA family protein [Pseudobdellovibrionaceae bacterium]